MMGERERAMAEKEEPKQDPSELRSFGLVLQALDEGTVHGDVSEDLYKLNTALMKHAESFGKAKGTITLTLTLTCERGGTCDVSADVKTKAPRASRAKTVLWMSKHGHLTNSNPRQLELGVPRAVPARPVRDTEKH
jgi:hypothetical protein